MNYKLYYSPGACSLAVHIVLKYSGLPYEIERVNLAKKDEIKRINSKGYVPLLQLPDGKILTEGVCIMQYVADQAHDKNLVPKWNTIERYKAIEWLNYITTEIHKGFSPLFNSKNLIDGNEEREKFNQKIQENLHKRIQWIEDQINSTEFILGDSFSIVDAYLFTCLQWAKIVKLSLDRYEKINFWMNRVREVESVNSAMKSEGLLK